MVELLKQEIIKHGDKAQILPIERLQDLKEDIKKFSHAEELNGFQKYIVSDMYQFDPPPVDFEICSVIIIASPTPSYAKVIFDWQGRKIPVVSLARAYEGREDVPTTTKQYLTEFLKPMGYHVAPAAQLPFKRLAVSSGLAAYGRNNICYVDGMGSFLNFAAYFTDVPSIEDSWREVRQMDCCDGCLVCIGNCPTGALRKDRFLIDNERCLSYFNEGPGEFPKWMPKTTHHCLYDCLMCQNICPQNNDYIGNAIGPIEFDEMETELLMSGKSMDEYPDSMKKKVKLLGMDQWLNAIPRNMKLLFDKVGFC